VSRNLIIMAKAGLLRSRREGRFTLYSLHPGIIRTRAEKPLDLVDQGYCVLNFEPKEQSFLPRSKSMLAD
jgi:hypothetical protein